MLSLDDFNRERSKQYEGQGNPQLNGIACPNCGKELWDSDPGIQFPTYPPQTAVYCRACEYCGMRVA